MIPTHPNPKRTYKANSNNLFKVLEGLEASNTPYILFYLAALEGKFQKAYPQHLGEVVFNSTAWVRWSIDRTPQ